MNAPIANRHQARRAPEGVLVLLVVLLTVTLAFSGCARLSRHKGMPAGLEAGRAMEEAPAPEAPAEMEYAADEEGGYDKAAVRATGATATALEVMAAAEAASSRKVIKTAELEIEVEALKQAQERVLDAVKNAGGFIKSLSVNKTSEIRTEARIVARIPSAGFREVYDKVKGLGEVKRDEVGGQDVTEEYMDLEKRIANKQVQEERLRELFKRTGKIADLLEVERELARVRGEIEQYQGRLRYLKDQVQFSTITIYLYELGEAPIAEGPGWKLIYHLRGAWLSLVRLMQALVAAVIYVVIVPLPFWVLLIILIVALRARARRRRAVSGPPERE